MSEQNPNQPEEESILSFEEFSTTKENGNPRYNNFWLQFRPAKIGDIYRQSEHYQKFAKEHLGLNESLLAEMNYEGFLQDDLSAVEADLYEVYKIMRGYGVSDEELFA